ncbi:MAG: DUF4374 domain-containing protein, partial [Tannerella sp.]|nr:DUF4374 domain-containing protein [Tannerella sp.]
MKTITKLQHFFLSALATSIVVSSFTSCDDKDNDPIVPETETAGAFFISISGETADYIIKTADLETGNLKISDNNKELEQSGYTWIFNDKPSVAIGLIYQQGDPGIGLGYRLKADGRLEELGQFQISSRFTSYGFFDKYALTSVGGKTPVDDNGNALLDAGGNERTDGVTFNIIGMEDGFTLREQSITTLNMAGNGEQATLSGIVDLGNGEFLTGLVLSKPRDPNATGGASTGTVTYPDSVWVAAFDANLNITRIYRDNRISYSSGRFRSTYYSQIGKADDGTVYVFSGSFEATTTRPAGALR